VEIIIEILPTDKNVWQELLSIPAKKPYEVKLLIKKEKM